MKSLLLEQSTGFNIATGWPVILLLGLLAILLVVNMFSRKKQGDKQAEMLNSLKIGDKVVTNAGIYGEIVEITATNFGKILLLKSGEGKNVSYISVNMSVVIGIDTKEPVVLDADGNIVEPEEKKEEVKVEKEEQKKEEKTETPKTAKKATSTKNLQQKNHN